MYVCIDVVREEKRRVCMWWRQKKREKRIGEKRE